jgi:hypothetical protein
VKRELRMNENEIIFTVEESPEGGYEARALGHSIFTQADTIEELRKMLRDAMNCHFEIENLRGRRAPRLKIQEPHP